MNRRAPGPTLETERLILRPPELADVDPWMAFMGSDASANIGGPVPALRAWGSLMMGAGDWALRGYGMFSVVEKASGACIGRVGPVHYEGWPGTEVGWAIIPVAQFGSVQVGQRAVIVPEEPLTGHYVGTVSVVDRVADAASGTFRARVLLENPDYALPSGLRCAVRFLQPGEAVADNIPPPPASRPLSRTALQSSRPRDLASAPSSSSPR